jgi:hypothetical protein
VAMLRCCDSAWIGRVYCDPQRTLE